MWVCFIKLGLEPELLLSAFCSVLVQDELALCLETAHLLSSEEWRGRKERGGEENPGAGVIWGQDSQRRAFALSLSSPVTLRSYPPLWGLSLAALYNGKCPTSEWDFSHGEKWRLLELEGLLVHPFPFKGFKLLGLRWYREGTVKSAFGIGGIIFMMIISLPGNHREKQPSSSRMEQLWSGALGGLPYHLNLLSLIIWQEPS